MMDIMLLTRQIADLEKQLAEYEGLRDQHKIYYAFTAHIRFIKQALEVCLKEASKTPKKTPKKLVDDGVVFPQVAPVKKRKPTNYSKKGDALTGKSGRPSKAQALTPAEEVRQAFAPYESLPTQKLTRVMGIKDLIPIEWNLTPTHKKVFIYLFEADSRLSTFEEIHSAYADKDYCDNINYMAVQAVLKNLQRILKRFGRDVLIYADNTACLDNKTLDLFTVLLEGHS